MENHPSYLGLYKKTEKIATFPGECNTNLPVYKKENAEYYLFGNCRNDWVLNSYLHPSDADIFADKLISDYPPRIGWKYWVKAEIASDPTMRVIAGMVEVRVIIFSCDEQLKK